MNVNVKVQKSANVEKKDCILKLPKIIFAIKICLHFSSALRKCSIPDVHGCVIIEK